MLRRWLFREVSDYQLWKGEVGPRWYEGMYVQRSDMMQYVIAPLPFCWLRKLYLRIRATGHDFRHAPSFDAGFQAGYNTGRASVRAELEAEYMREFGRDLRLDAGGK